MNYYELLPDWKFLWNKIEITCSFDWISEEAYFVANEQLMYITGIFLYLNSTINPIIYSLISSKYRKAFKETSCG